MNTNYVLYFRVSTLRQGTSGLGIEAQRHTVNTYLMSNPGNVVAEFTEIESGKNDDREELNKAIELSKMYNATLLIAKIDRLSRKVSFISRLMEEEIKFTACDNPNIDQFTIHILAAVSEQERKLISLRTKEALARAKARGVKLGNPRNLKNREEGSIKSVKVRQTKAQDFAMKTYRIIEPLLEQGLSLRQIAKELNSRNLPTARGNLWKPQSVSNIVKRISQI